MGGYFIFFMHRQTVPDTGRFLLRQHKYLKGVRRMLIRDYCIHMINGEHIVLPGEINIPADKTIPGKFKAAQPDDVITFGDPDIGFFYIPKKNILFIRTVREG